MKQKIKKIRQELKEKAKAVKSKQKLGIKTEKTHKNDHRSSQRAN